MQRCKKPKQQSVTMKKSDLYKTTRESAKRATDTACLLMIISAIDELNITDEQVIAIMTRTARYAEYIDDKVVQINTVKELIEKKTGIHFSV